MENFELYIDIIKRLNERILRSKFEMGNRDISFFLKDMKQKLQTMMLNADDARLCLITSLETNAQTCGILVKVPIADDHFNIMDLWVDIETGKIGVTYGDDFEEYMSFKGKIYSSEFIIDKELNLLKVIGDLNIPFPDNGEFNQMLYVYDYIRNDQSLLAELINEAPTR